MYRLAFHCVALFILSLLFIACVSKSDKSKQDKVFEVCRVVIASPYGCYQEIEFTDKGDGVLKSGLHNGTITGVGVSLDTLFSADSFHIKEGQDLKNIRSVIKSVLSSKNVKGGPRSDAYRHQLFIDEINKVDIYGLSKDLQELLKYLINYLPLSTDKCEFFELFKKSISSSQ